MGRLVLVLTLALSNVGHAQGSVIGAYEDLARHMDERNWQSALASSRHVLELSSGSNPLRDTVECMYALLLELQLQDHLAATPTGIDELSRELGGIARVLEQLGDAYPACTRDAPATVATDEHALRGSELSYIQPRAERASVLVGQARESESVSAELEQVFAREHAEIVAQIPPGPEDAWRRAERLWRDQRTPAAQPERWPAEGEVPFGVTGVLFVGFGLVSFLSTLTALSGSGLPSLSAGGWGITFSLLPALASAWTWEKPKRSLLVASLALTSVAAAGGVAAVSRLDRDGRFFGRGLLIGSALSVVWQIGGWIHYRYPDRSRREWRERVQIAPTAGRGFGGLSASGRF